jgi:hypothetical protein
MDTGKQPKVQWGPCCFCAEEILPVSVDPCRVTVSTAQDKWQTWFCHANCFKQQLALKDAELEMLLAPAHF